MAKTRKRYPSLLKELEADGTIGQLDILETVQPVVILHEHCEGSYQTINGGFAGITAAPNEAFSITLPRGGAFQVIAQVYASVAVVLVGTTEVVTFRSRSTTLADAGVAFLRFDWGSAGIQSIAQTVVIPKIHFDEGTDLIMQLGTALIANDFVFGLLTVQPV